MTIEKLFSFFDMTPPSEEQLGDFFDSLEPQDQAAFLILMYGYEIEGPESFENFNEQLQLTHQFLKETVFDPNYILDEYVLEILEKNAVFPYANENVIRDALHLGFYTLAMPLFNKSFLTIEYHLEKLIIKPEDFHIPKIFPRLERKFSNYKMTFNKDFNATIDALVETYPETWLTPELVEAFKNIHKNPDEKVSMNSVEIWNDKGELVAGEIGFITKQAYASLSGFHKEKDTGTFQMVKLGKYLFEKGFAYWDLGMALPYKYRFGAKEFDRDGQEKLWTDMKEGLLSF